MDPCRQLFIPHGASNRVQRYDEKLGPQLPRLLDERDHHWCGELILQVLLPRFFSVVLISFFHYIILFSFSAIILISFAYDLYYWNKIIYCSLLNCVTIVVNCDLWGNDFSNISVYIARNRVCACNIDDYPYFGLCEQWSLFCLKNGCRCLVSTLHFLILSPIFVQIWGGNYQHS